jgi:hypothetical protein
MFGRRSKGSRYLFSLSVDLDEIPNYFKIHGLDTPEGAATAVYDIAVDRLKDLARGLGVPLTMFTVGSDLERPEAAAKLRACREVGFEIANHSLDHRYDLTRLTSDDMRAQIKGGADAIERAVGERPVGFRAPGYTINDDVFRVLTEEGVEYDSSVFPCPAYFAAKTAAISIIAARGRTSQSVVDTPFVLMAPTGPYKVGMPYYTRGQGMLELPVQVTRGPKLPFIGTSVTAAGPRGARVLARMCKGLTFVNLELHGIDVLDASDGLEELRAYQMDVRIPRQRKIDAISEACKAFLDDGYAAVTMREAADHYRTLDSDQRKGQRSVPTAGGSRLFA